ncbi:MAG: hypothetical protein AB7V27_11180 [Candidatus Binatia bacterium]
MVPKMSPVIIPEELIASEPALPVQFQDIWHRTRYVSPERSLVLSVVWQAVIDLQKYRFAKRRRQQRLFMEAYNWVASTDRKWPYAFENIAEMLNVDSERLREQLIGNSEPIFAPMPAPSLEVEEAAAA